MKHYGVFAGLIRIKKSALSRLFFLLMSLTVLSIIIIISVWTVNVHKNVHELSDSYISDIVRNANSKFENDLYTLRSNLSTITANDNTRTYLLYPTAENKAAAREYLLNNFDILINDINGIALISPNTTITAGAYFPEGLSETKLYKSVTENSESTVILNRRSIYKTSPQSGIALAKAVTFRGKVLGIVLLDLKSSIITNHFGISHMNGLLRTVILDPDNNIIFTNESDLNENKLSVLLSHVNQSKPLENLSTATIDGDEYFITAKRFSSSPDWLNITFCPTKSLYSSYRQMLRLLMTIMIFIILITVLLSLLTFSSTKKSFKQLSDHIEKIDLNNINEIKSFTPSANDSEIVMISDKINQLVDTISEQLKSINSLEEKKRMDEIQILKAQINPHMIYNTLNVIQTSAEYQKNTTISEISKSLTMLLRYSVTDTDKLVLLKNEFEYIKGYMTLMQHKFVNDIHLEIMADDSVLNCMTLKMLLQPIAENSLKHGFTDKPGQFIIIKAYRSDNKVLIKITDNGLGIAPDKLKNLLNPDFGGSSHLGLNNVNRRLKLTFGNEYGISISSIPCIQTSVLIEIPYIPPSQQQKEIEKYE